MSSPSLRNCSGTALAAMVLMVAAASSPRAAWADLIDDGIADLTMTQAIDGSWGGEVTSPATVFQATSEALETLSFDRPEPFYSDGIAWIAAQDTDSVDHQARQIFSLATAGNATASLAGTLAGAQNADGGFGIETGFGSDILDTSLALRALARSGAAAAPTLQGALAYLLASRNADGGVGLLPGESSTVYDTAIYLLALREYQVNAGDASGLVTAMTAACSWLAGEQRGDGGWGAVSSTVFETGLAAYALARASCGFDAPGAVAFLSAQYTADMWNANAYEVALATRALLLIERPNLSFGPSGITFDPVLPIQNEDVTITVQVQNFGLVDTPNVTVRFYDGDPDAGGTAIDEEVIANLAAGAAATASIVASFPDLGPQDIRVRIDPDDVHTETSEIDNDAQATLQIVVPAPDLTLQGLDISFAPPAPGQGETFTISATVHNQGRLDASGVVVRFFDGDPAAGGTPIGSDQTIAAIATGGSAVASVEHSVLPDGPATVFVVLDPDDAIVESLEDNNQASASVDVQPVPDLSVDAAEITFDPAAPVQGQDVDLSVVVRNLGAGDAGAFSVQAFAGDPDSGGLMLFEWSVGGLASNSLGVRLDATLGNPPTGDLEIHVLVDVADAVTEIDENNNRAVKLLTVSPLPDVAIATSNLSTDPLFPSPGAPFDITALVRNLGDADVSDVLVRFFDGDPAAGGIQIGSDQVLASIPAGGSAPAAVSHVRPAEGQFKLYVQVDPEGTIFEASEANNNAFRTVLVSDSPLFQPADPYVGTISDDSRLYVAGSNGDGTFSALEFVEDIGSNSRGLAIADFDGDGDFDVVTGYGATSPEIHVYLFPRTGSTFETPIYLGPLGDSIFSAGNYPEDMAAGDFNNDGAMDFLVGGDSDHTWYFQHTGPMVTEPENFYAADFETGNDGWGGAVTRTSFARDDATSSQGDWSMRVFATGTPSALSIDVNPSDWYLSRGSTVRFDYRIPPGTPVGLLFNVSGYGWIQLGGTSTADADTYPVSPLAVTLMDDDTWRSVEIDIHQAIRAQWPDASQVTEFEWWTDSNAGDGQQFWFDDFRITRPRMVSGFDVTRLPSTGGSGRGMDAGNADDDGNLDFVRGRTSSGYVYLYTGDGNGGFTPSASEVADPGNDPYGVVLADFDNDAIDDIIANNSSSGDPRLFRGNGDGSFQSGDYIGSLDTNNYTSLGAYDFDADGNQDVVAATYTSRQLWYYPGLGDGSFGERTLIGATTSPAVNILSVAAPAGRVVGQPFALASADTVLAGEGTTVNFDGSDSYDDGNIVSYQWDFGDGSTATGPTPSHAFSSEGRYTVILTVVDDEGLEDRAAVRLVILGDPPVADAGGPYTFGEDRALRGRWNVTLDGTASTDSDTDIVSWAWDFDDGDGVGVDATGPFPRFSYSSAGTYTITLTVTDGVGLTHTTTDTVNIIGESDPVAIILGPGAPLDESDASLGQWAGWYDVSFATDLEGVATLSIDWLDGTDPTVLAPLSDDFRDGDFTSDPAWNVNGGTWSVVDGVLQQSALGSAWRWLQDLNRTYRDFELEVDIRGVDTGSNDGYVGIVFRNPNTAGNTSSLLLYSRDSWDYWRFYDWSTGTTLAEGGTGWDEGAWYHLRLRVEGDQMRLFVTPEGGVETLQVETTRAGFPEGGIGLLANDQLMQFDNVKVTPLDKDWTDAAVGLHDVAHGFKGTGDYEVTLEVTDHALQSSTAVLPTEVVAGDAPVADAGGPVYVLDETDATNGRWDFILDASASFDDNNVQRYELDFGDGTGYTTAFASGEAASYFAAGTDLYSFDTPSARLGRIIATEDDTEVRVIDLETSSVLGTSTLDRFGAWDFTPPEGSYVKVESTRPVVVLNTNFGSHSAFVPSLDQSPVGNEFLFEHYNRFEGFFVYAYEDAQVSFFNTSGTLVSRRAIRAGDYWAPALANSTRYRVVATGKVAMQTVGNNAYTTVPSSSGDGAGRLFLFATHTWTTGAFVVFAHEATSVDVYDLDTGELLFTRVMAAGEMYFEDGAGTRRLRLESDGDVEVWAGGTEGNGIENLGDDISMAGGRGATDFWLHSLGDGVVVFAPSDGTQVSVDDGALVEDLDRDGFLRLVPADFPGGPGVHRITSNKPVIIQTLGSANAFNDLGTWLGGVSARHRYEAVGTYTVTVTAIDNVGQRDTATAQVQVTQSDPPVAAIVAPPVLDESFASNGEWIVTFDGGGSTDDVEITSFTWDFGDGSTGSGMTPTHAYDTPGVYTVTLTVTDRAGQIGEATFDVSVQANEPPVADSGGPYVFGEEAASFGVWTANLDARGSSDDFAILDYLWTLHDVLADDFTGTTLDTERWTASDGVTQDGAVTVQGTVRWDNRYLTSVQSFERGAVFQARLTTAASGIQQSMWGFKDESSSTSYTAMPHAIYFDNGTIRVYEDGANRGIFGSGFVPGDSYDVRITMLPGQGAVYEYKRADEADWTLLYTSSYSSESPLLVHGTVYRGDMTVDDVKVDTLIEGATPGLRFDSVGVRNITLRVRDNALQESVDSTTISIESGDAPVADAGGPYTAEVGSEVLLNGAASSDDNAIESYHWNFGNTTGGPADLPFEGKGAVTRHFYDEPGDYEVTLTVTDNVGNTDTATAQVTVVVGSAPIASIAPPTDAAAGGPPAYFDARTSADDFGIVEYRWDFDDRTDRDGDGNFTNDVDAVGPRPFHIFPIATELVLDETFDGTVLDTSAWLSAGATQDDAVTVTGAGNWTGSYLFSSETFGRGASHRARITPVNTSGNQYAMIGLKDTDASFSYTQMPHAIYFNNGSINIYEQGSNRGRYGSYTRGVTYEIRIDVKHAGGATYFVREAGTADWTELYDSTNRSETPLRMGITVNSGVFTLDDFVIGGEPFVVTLTVEDGAGQTDTASVVVPVALNLPPDVITVPWVPQDPVVPHETYDGKAIRLKGIVRDGDPKEYQWDFGDGTRSPVTDVTDPYDLSVSHTYPDAPVGTPFTATLTVWDEAGQMGQDTYNIIVRPLTLDTEVNVAIDEGLWYLHQTQTRSAAEGYATGYWTSNARASATASALQAFQINGHLESSDNAEVPYAETVARGLRQLFRDLGTVNIGVQTYGEPDTNGNGIGIETGVNGSGNQPIYQGGQVMDAIAASGNRLARTVTGADGVKRRRYFDILQDMVDQFAWGQVDSGSGQGGWRYGWNYSSSDNSAAQWGAIGLLAAQDIFGIPVPPWVKEQNRVWLDYSYNGAGYGYSGPNTSYAQAGTPSGLVQSTFSGRTTEDRHWKTAEKWIADNWTNQYIINEGNRPYYPYFALSKAMRLARPAAVEVFSSSGLDWFHDPDVGLARTLVDDQLASGEFPGSEWITQQLRSAWGVIILSQTLFVQTPVAVAGRDRAWAVDRELTFDGSRSYHNDPFRNIVLYEWDFDGDGVYDSSSPDPLATHTYTKEDYPDVTEGNPVTVTVTLRVTDDQTPALTDTDTVRIIVAEPPHPPVADAGPPGTPAGTRYVCTVGVPCLLDGSDSLDIDPFDEIVRYEWELDNQFPFDFDEASGETTTWVFDTPGVFDVGLRVFDNGQFNDLNENGQVDEDERLSDQEFVKVEAVPNVAPVADANGPYVVDEGSSIALDATGSSDPNGDPLSYMWDLDNDGEFDDASGPTPAFTGVDDGVYPVAVQATDTVLDNTAASSVTVRNVAPDVDPGPDQTVTEGDSVSFNGGFTDPGILDTHTYSWTFGDGTPPVTGTLTPTHVYADDGVYTVTLTVTDDDDGIGSGTLSVTVNNADPVVNAGPDQEADEGTVVNLAPAAFTDAGTLDSHTASVDWGDGSSPVTATVTESTSGPPGDPAGMAGTVDASHVYADNGVYTVTVTVEDDDGGSSSDTLTVTVGNVAPVVEAGPDQEADEGQVVSLDPATFTDAGTLDTHTAIVDWGDGSTPSSGAVTELSFGPPGDPAGMSGSVQTTHVYADNGLYTVTVTVTDDDLGSASDTFEVMVGNLPPVVEAGPDQSVGDGTTVSLDPATFTDPGTLDTHSATVNWGDGSPVQSAVVSESPFGPPGDEAGASGTVSANHVYPGGGSYTVTVTVTDDDSGEGSDTFRVTVASGAIEVDAGPDQTVNEGDMMTFAGGFTNTDPTAQNTIQWDFGDGSPTVTGTLTPTHVYADDGVYTVRLTVTDDGGDSGADTMTVTVNNVAPDVDAGPDTIIDEGDTFTSAGSFTDPGSDTWTATVDYGDGSGEQPLALNPDGSFDLAHTYADDGVYTVTVTVTDDDDGSGTDTAEVTVNNVAPDVDAGPDATIDEGDTFMSAGSFTDPGSDTWTATVDYGDGSGEQPLALNPDGTFDLDHTYPTEGVYTVTVRVTDDDNASGADTAQVAVIAGGGTPPQQTVFDLTARPKSGKVSLVWTPVQDATGYNVYRAQTPGGPYALIAANHQTDYSTYLDGAVTNEVTYYYVVTSISGGSESLGSNEASATPTALRRR